MDSPVFCRFLRVDVKSIGVSFFENLLYLCLRLSSCPYRIFWVCFSRRHVDWLKTSFILVSQFEFNGLILFGTQYFYVHNAWFSNILITLKKNVFLFFFSSQDLGLITYFWLCPVCVYARRGKILFLFLMGQLMSGFLSPQALWHVNKQNLL